jgi:organic radical activating enzyme
MIEGCNNNTTKVFIEFTPHCNFDCDFCAHHLVTRNKGYLKFSDLDRILDQVKRHLPNTEYIALSAMGEPLLHPNFIEMCQKIKNEGYQLIVTTNGSLVNETHYKVPVDRWYISYRSTSEDSFRHRNTVMPYVEYTKRVAQFVRNSKHQFMTIYLHGNEKGIGRDQNVEGDFAGALDISDKETFIKHVNYFGKLFCPTFTGVDEKKQLLNTHYKIRDGLYFYLGYVFNWTNLILPQGYVVKPSWEFTTSCFYDNHVVFYWNGDVSTCCMDFDGILKIGNVFERNLDKILENRSPKDMLLPLKRFCRNCQGQVVKT